MGVYLNPGTNSFQECLNSEIYIDKTGLIRFTNSVLCTEKKLVCVSRPRRFGKSMALKMLSAYYSKGCDAREMFSALKIGQTRDEDSQIARQKKDCFEKGLNRYDTLYLDIQGIIACARENARTQRELTDFYEKIGRVSPEELEKIDHPLLRAMQREVVCDIREDAAYGALIPEDEQYLGNALHQIYKRTGNQFVLLIDEWDCIFRNYENDKLLQDKYIGWLRDLFKNSVRLPMYALVYMTGILPIKRYGGQSALNNFFEFTMLDMYPLEEFAGFTEEETRELYQTRGMDWEKACEWYDGYMLGEFGHVFNPNSVVESVSRRRFRNYWTATGTYESVKKVIDMNFDGLKDKVVTMLGNGRCRVNVSKFQNDMVTFQSADDALTLLIHLGYLGYDAERREVYIPNKEIRDEFVNAIDGEKWTYTYEAIAKSEKLLRATLDGEEAMVANLVEEAHRNNTAILTYNNENSLSCVIQIAYYQAQDDYMLVREMLSGKGFCDIAFIPRKGVDKPAILVELKWEKNVQTALNQIRERHYSDSFQKYFGEVLLVGISYEKDSKEKSHTCRIERLRKTL